MSVPPPVIVIEDPWLPPSVTDVAAVLRARTKDFDGVEVGDFNANTRPTDVEAQRLVDLAYAEVCGYVGDALATRCAGLARSLVIVRAAWWIEGSYWPEQVRSNRSIYDELRQQFLDGMPQLLTCAESYPDADASPDTALDFGMLNVHGWTSEGPPFGTPPEPLPPDVEPY